MEGESQSVRGLQQATASAGEVEGLAEQAAHPPTSTAFVAKAVSPCEATSGRSLERA